MEKKSLKVIDKDKGIVEVIDLHLWIDHMYGSEEDSSLRVIETFDHEHYNVNIHDNKDFIKDIISNCTLDKQFCPRVNINKCTLQMVDTHGLGNSKEYNIIKIDGYKVL